MARFMEDYPNTLTQKARGDDNAGYWSAFTYAVSALKEAILRFPDDLHTEGWQWRLAQSMARSGDEAGSEIYANLIASALNRNDTSIEYLPDWFRSKEPGSNLYIIETPPPAGSHASYLLQLESAGSAFIWLLEGPSGFSAYSLADEFDFNGNIPSRVILSDLTGDGFEEAVVFKSNERITSPGSSTAEQITTPVQDFTLPRVFDLSKTPGKELFFAEGEDQTKLNIDFLNRWGMIKNPDGQNNLVFDGLTFPACPVTIHFEYAWDGTFLRRVGSDYSVDPQNSQLPLCHVIVDHAEQHWDTQASIKLMEALLPVFQPEAPAPGKILDPTDEANAKDEWIYRLGISHALIGNFETALDYFKTITQRDPAALPPFAERQWHTPANDFLNRYQEAEDVYAACLDAPLCDPSRALSYLGRNLPESSLVDPNTWLFQHGVNLISSGYQDFDGDATPERWFVTRHRPLEKPELWIIAETLANPLAVLVDNVDAAKPVWQILEGENGETVVKMGSGRHFMLARHPETKMPLVNWLEPPFRLPPAATMPNRFNREVMLAEQALFAGEDPVTVMTNLSNLKDFPGLVCETTWTCDRYYYLLGLAAELAGNEKLAVEAYLELWRNYARSPFTTMARLKLLGAALSLTTPTPIQAPSTTITATPGAYPLPTSTPVGGYPLPTQPVWTPYPSNP